MVYFYTRNQNLNKFASTSYKNTEAQKKMRKKFARWKIFKQNESEKSLTTIILLKILQSQVTTLSVFCYFNLQLKFLFCIIVHLHCIIIHCTFFCWSSSNFFYKNKKHGHIFLNFVYFVSHVKADFLNLTFPFFCFKSFSVHF